MNCEEVEKQLPEFLDQRLGVQSIKDLDRHLSACPRCCAELANLVEWQRLVTHLTVVEPPVDFTARVMAQVREAGRRSGIWMRLCLPLELKIPLQAAAIALIGILSIYVYDKKKTDQSTSSQIAENHLSSQSAEEKKAEISGQARSAVEKKYAGELRSRSPRSVQDMAKPAPDQGTSLQASDELAASTPTAEIKDSTLPDKREEFTSRPKASAGAALPLSIDSPREASDVAADKALSSRARSTPDYELVVRLRSTESRIQAPPARADALRRRAESHSGAQPRQGGILARTPASPLSDSITEIIWYSVPQGQYEEFKKELAAQVNIEFETPMETKEKAAARKPEDNLSIKVTVLPPR